MGGLLSSCANQGTAAQLRGLSVCAAPLRREVCLCAHHGFARYRAVQVAVHSVGRRQRANDLFKLGNARRAPAQRRKKVAECMDTAQTGVPTAAGFSPWHFLLCAGRRLERAETGEDQRRQKGLRRHSQDAYACPEKQVQHSEFTSGAEETLQKSLERRPL